MIQHRELAEITEALAVISRKIELYSAQGQYDINMVCEDFFTPILAKIFSCPDLHNLNSEQAAFAGVDLGSDLKKIAIQVSSTKRSAKINKTIEKFLDHNWDTRFTCLYVLILGKKQQSYALKRTSELVNRGVDFTTKNIWGFEELISKIKELQPDEITIIHHIICNSSSILKKVEDLKKRQKDLIEYTKSKIEREYSDGRYLPEAYVDPIDLKERVRFFSYPDLMYSKINFVLRNTFSTRLDYLLQLSGRPPISQTLTPPTFDSINHIESNKAELQKLIDIVAKYDFYTTGEEITPEDDLDFYYSHMAISSAALTNKYSYLKALAFLRTIQSKVFFITDEAGKGKTNFLCDFVTNFTIKHEIPTFFFTSQDVYTHRSDNFFSFLNKHYHLSEFQNERELLQTLSHLGHEIKKPCLIVIDGLNEANRLPEFSQQLKDFILKVSKHREIKLLLTCRSELFDQRFSWINESIFEKISSKEDKLFEYDDNVAPEQMLEGYFKHFNVKAILSKKAKGQLRHPLLLRVFCETYRDASAQEFQSIYRFNLFVTFVTKKFKALGTESARENGLRAIAFLDKVATQMIKEGKFSGIPLSSISESDDKYAAAVISEGFILRQDNADDDFGCLLQTISFSFDQLRDFFIARNLYEGLTNGTFNWNTICATIFSSHNSIVEDVSYFLFMKARTSEDHDMYEKLVGCNVTSVGWTKFIFELDDNLVKSTDEALVLKKALSSKKVEYWITKLLVRGCIENKKLIGLDLLQSLLTRLPENQNLTRNHIYDAMHYTRFKLNDTLSAKRARSPESEGKIKKIIKWLNKELDNAAK